MRNCFPLVRKYWTEGTFSFGLAIDDFEYVKLAALLDDEFPELERSTVVVNHHPQGSGGRLSRTHEYFILLAPSTAPAYLGKPKDDEEEDRSFMRSGTGENNYRSGRWKSFYALLLDPSTSKVVDAEPPVPLGTPYPTENTDNGFKRIYPINSRGEERVWRSSYETGKQRAANGELWISERGAIYQNIEHEGKRETIFSNWTDTSFNAGINGTGVLASMGLGGIFDYPKSVATLETGLWAQSFGKPDFTVLDYFGGSGTTAHAVIVMNRKDSGERRFVIVEMGEYFSLVTLPRIKKAIYSQDWDGGKPIARDGIGSAFKYFRLESYEDCLNNLALNPAIDIATGGNVAALKRDYLLRYMLDVETQGSQSLLNVAQFRDPTAYQLEIKKPGSDEREKRSVDLVETFNWLIGLHVDKLHAGRRFAATFVRKPDPLLPEDANTRLQVETLTEAEDGAWWFRPVEGYVRTKPGDDRHRQSVLVLWRTLTDDPEQDAAALEAFLSQQMKFDPTRREDKTLYDIIYINGTHNLPNLGKYGEVRLLEEEFHRRMWAGEEA
jgi:adenine-specific DNA-methyltransferase